MNIGAVIRYWKRRWIGSLVTISSGIGRPAPVVITRDVPSTVQDAMPGNHSCTRAGSPTIAQTRRPGALDPDFSPHQATRHPHFLAELCHRHLLHGVADADRARFDHARIDAAQTQWLAGR